MKWADLQREKAAEALAQIRRIHGGDDSFSEVAFVIGISCSLAHQDCLAVTLDALDSGLIEVDDRRMVASVRHTASSVSAPQFLASLQAADKSLMNAMAELGVDDLLSVPDFGAALKQLNVALVAEAPDWDDL